MKMIMDHANWFQQHYHSLSGHGVWMRGGEINTLDISEFDRRDFRFLICRLSTYRDTASSFTHSLLYQIAAAIEGVFPDLAWLPPLRDSLLFEQNGISWWTGTQTKKSPAAFDCLAISNSIVQELINLPLLMLRSGIPLYKSDRMKRTDLPLVILGGSNAAAASMLWVADPPVDGIFIGDDTRAIEQLITICRDAKRLKISKMDLLVQLESIPGFIQPDSPRPVTISFNETNTVVEKAPILYNEDEIGVGHIPITRGCPHSCTFCFESWIHKPYREIEADTVVAQALRQKTALGLEEIELFSFNFGMHRRIIPLFHSLINIFPKIGLKSQRFDQLARNPYLLEHLQKIDKVNITCALEGISPRLRDYLGKGLSEHHITGSLNRLLHTPIRGLKVFLIATGLEEDQDFTQFNELLIFMRDTRESSDTKPRIIFSTTPLVRFPHTPLEFEDGCDAAKMQRCINAIGHRVKRAGFEHRASADASEYLLSQTLCRAVDPRIWQALCNLVTRSGFIYYDGIAEGFAESFIKECNQLGLDTASLLGAPKHTPVWECIDTGIPRAQLRECYEKGHASLQPNLHNTKNQTTTSAQTITLMESEPQYSPAVFAGCVKTIRSKQTAVQFLVTVHESCRGIARKYCGVNLARGIMQSAPHLTQYYRGYRSSLCSADTWGEWIFGQDIITLAWDSECIGELNRLFTDAQFISRVNEICKPGLAVHSLTSRHYRQHLTFQSPFPCNPESYLLGLGLKHTRKRLNPSTYLFELSPVSLKKGVLSELTVRTIDPSLFQADLIPGERFSVNTFLSEAFDLADPDNKARILIHVQLESV